MARSTTIAVTVFVVALPQLHAQSPACSSPSTSSTTTARIAAGIGQSDRVDFSVSPVQFGGRGLDVSGSLERAVGSFCVTASGRGGKKTLTAVSGSSSVERLTEAEVAVSAFHALRPELEARRMLSIGAELRGDLAVTNHAYGNSSDVQSVANFRVGTLTLGPAVRWRQQIGSGQAVAQIATPVFGVVDHPYVSGRDDPRFQVVSLNALRGANGSLSYEFTPQKKMSVLATYRVSGMRFDDVRPVRSLTQTLTIGISTKLGSRR